MAQSSKSQNKGGSLTAGGGAGTVNVTLSAATAKDLLTALSQAVGTGSKLKTKLAAGSRSKLAAPKARSKAAAPKAASRATSKAAAPKAGSRVAKPK
ncbi:MAG TPA: hypothetical protein VIE43_26560 [Thermoanaerobaculia bacterium]|nr:hypothetical protein [Thermoanaerobaculia bacterium]